MEKLVLEAKELLFLSARLGASNFYGVPDPFFGMTRDEVVGGIAQIQLQLEEKQIVSLGFDGTVDIDHNAAEIISTCALCDKYISVEAISEGRLLPKKSFYIRGAESAELFQEKGLMTLQPVSVNAFENAVLGLITEYCSSVCVDEAPARIPQDSLARAKAEQDKAKQVLMDAGCTSQMADVITAGLNGTGGYFMITAIDAVHNSISDFVCVGGPAGTVRLEVAVDSESAWIASWMGSSEIGRAVRQLIQQRTGDELS